jgi:predicted transcriptional regulator YdeE
METYQLHQPIPLICTRARNFPQGVPAAFEHLYQFFPEGSRRTFGASWPQNGVMTYLAGVEMHHSEESLPAGFEKFVLPAGQYLCSPIHNFPNQMEEIANTFSRLLQYPNIAPDGFCLEYYLNRYDMLCLVKLQDNR